MLCGNDELDVLSATNENAAIRLFRGFLSVVKWKWAGADVARALLRPHMLERPVLVVPLGSTRESTPRARWVGARSICVQSRRETSVSMLKQLGGESFRRNTVGLYCPRDGKVLEGRSQGREISKK